MAEVKIVEVGLRDGLQNEPAMLSAELKRELISRLAEAGVKHLEVTSFVHPKWIPQLSDADLVASNLPDLPVTYRALVPNRQGLERALKTGVDEYAVFMSASDTHNRKNINKSMKETLPVLKEVVDLAHQEGKRIRGYVSTVFGCPYEGEVPVKTVAWLCEHLLQMGVYEISLGDTIGVAAPQEVKQKLNELLTVLPASRLAGHFHDTRGTGLANAYVCLEAGVHTLDTSFGGLGGCPYAPGAAGNLATEDLVYMLERSGVKTGIDLNRLCETSLYVQKHLNKPLPSKFLKSYAAERKKQKEGQ
ncbi:hydroxymethylglutaryl-CoA lyase [Thermoactinomyces mirandus]|uniref:Hydroxymethylglutaryl-CoA lyase n=1 Tax=Thermoactinomyces mirandus TaxID=2756294 RepID=A0A7W2AQ66_9BACL|nr:hydroxymethylglutaryl-CoA lyase [Thermoactinomyces mirandus]MBA4601178.1 hydroxymethylglutaryl-CoA lyase [Thermoactinomyces mirandus]